MEKSLAELSERAISTLQVLCSNYRGNMTVTAGFKCRKAYGIVKFQNQVQKYLRELKRKHFIVSFSVTEPEEQDNVYVFDVTAAMDLSVEDMAEVAVNSQTVFRPD